MPCPITIQTAYTPESWAKMVRNPQDRFDFVRPATEGLGGRIDTAYIACGAYDFTAIVEFPDNVSAAALSMSVSATAGVKSYKTTRLMTMAEAQSAMKMAGGSNYALPK